MLRILICDDDLATANAIQAVVESALDGAGKRAKIYTYTDAGAISRQIMESCDIALLDIDYDGIDYNGMDIARKLRSFARDAVIIFVTNFIEYAPAGYEVGAFRYILKRDLEEDLKAVLPLALGQLHGETLPIQVDGEIIKIPLEDILYLEVQQHCVTAVTQKGEPEQERYEFHASLSDLEERLEPQGFLRIHKSYLVNMRHLKKFQCREATLDNGMTLRVGEKSYGENKQKFLLWKGWQ